MANCKMVHGVAIILTAFKRAKSSKCVSTNQTGVSVFVAVSNRDTRSSATSLASLASFVWF